MEQMQKENGWWKDTGDRFREFKPSNESKVPSEWWIAVYSIRRLFRGRFLTANKRENEETVTELTGAAARRRTLSIEIGPIPSILTIESRSPITERSLYAESYEPRILQYEPRTLQYEPRTLQTRLESKSFEAPRIERIGIVQEERDSASTVNRLPPDDLRPRGDAASSIGPSDPAETFRGGRYPASTIDPSDSMV